MLSEAMVGSLLQQPREVHALLNLHSACQGFWNLPESPWGSQGRHRAPRPACAALHPAGRWLLDRGAQDASAGPDFSRVGSSHLPARLQGCACDAQSPRGNRGVVLGGSRL